jgi:hypothetical protein
LAAPGTVCQRLAGGLQCPVGFGELQGHPRSQGALRLHPLGPARARPRRDILHFQLDHAAGQLSATHFQQQAASIAGFERQFGAFHLPAGAQVLEDFGARFGIVDERRRPENAAHDFAADAPAQPQERRIRFHHAAGGLFQQQHAGPQIVKCLGEEIAGVHIDPLPSVPQPRMKAG